MDGSDWVWGRIRGKRKKGLMEEDMELMRGKEVKDGEDSRFHHYIIMH